MKILETTHYINVSRERLWLF